MVCSVIPYASSARLLYHTTICCCVQSASCIDEQVHLEYRGWGSSFATTIVGVVLLNQILGPPLFKWVIRHVGDAHESASGGLLGGLEKKKDHGGHSSTPPRRPRKGVEGQGAIRGGAAMQQEVAWQEGGPDSGAGAPFPPSVGVGPPLTSPMVLVLGGQTEGAVAVSPCPTNVCSCFLYLGSVAASCIYGVHLHSGLPVSGV